MVWESVTGQKKGRRSDKSATGVEGKWLSMAGTGGDGLPDDAPLRECKKVCWWCTRVLEEGGTFLDRCREGWGGDGVG